MASRSTRAGLTWRGSTTFWLGGKDNYAADRAVAEQVASYRTACWPVIA